jgi:hypothetical protein
MALDDLDLADVYEWIDDISPRLSATPRNCAHDFSDAVLVAEIIRLSFPKSVDLHNYPRTNTVTEKIQNWETLHRKVLKKMKVPFSKTQARALAKATPGEVEIVLLKIKNRIRAIKDNHAAGGLLKTAKNGEGEAEGRQEGEKSSKKDGGAKSKEAPPLLTDAGSYDINGMRIKTEEQNGPITSPETVEELMQMEKYHRLLIRKLKAEASHDYEQYAEAVASLDGFEDWVGKYHTHPDEEADEDRQNILASTMAQSVPLKDRPKFMTTTRRETYFSKDGLKLKSKEDVKISDSAMEFAKEKWAAETGNEPREGGGDEFQAAAVVADKSPHDFDLSATQRARNKGGARAAAVVGGSTEHEAQGAAERNTSRVAPPPPAPEAASSSTTAAADETDSASEDGDEGDESGFTNGSFVYLKNARFEPAKESVKNPRYWIARVDSFMPPAQYRLKWMKESKTGSGMFEEKPAQFIEAEAILKPIAKMEYIEELKMFRWDSAATDIPDTGTGRQ